MARVELDRLTKVFRDEQAETVAVDNVSVDIEDGEFLVLVGPSGCGKSTTLRMIAGLETITDGEIRLDGSVLNDVAPQDRDIAMVFQSYALYPHKSVRGNMSFGLEQSTDLPDDEIADLIEEAAEMMGIDELLDRKPAQLSGGQQQRVALGRAIVRDPDVFLMDEPLSNLDAKLRAQMRTELQTLQNRLGVTTVYVTHDQTEAMTMGDRMAVMNDGRLQQVGEPLELYHRPANRFVAEFIGDPSMNFFEGTQEGDRFVTDEFAYPLSGEMRDGIEGQIDEAGRLTLGIRPEDIVIETDALGDREEAHTVEMDVLVVEPMGDENVVHLQFPDTTGTDEDMVAVIGGRRAIEAGESVQVSLPPATIHLFDGVSGEAVHNRKLESEAAARQV